MARSFERKKRNQYSRAKKPIMVIAAEGRNVTEFQYLLSFRSQDSKYTIVTHRNGYETDPIRLMKSVEQYWEENQLSKDLGDKAYIFLDIDCDQNREKKIKKAMLQAKHVEFINSNPCFEVWFLFHFQKTTHRFYGSDDLLKELKKYISDYDKTTEIYKLLLPMMNQAFINAEFARYYFMNLGTPWPSYDCNPRTDVPKAIKNILLKKGE